MADFARIKSQDVWINLDYVVRIEPTGDEAATARLTFVDGSTFTVSKDDHKRLLGGIRPKKKKKKKKKPATPEAEPPAAEPGQETGF